MTGPAFRHVIFGREHQILSLETNRLVFFSYKIKNDSFSFNVSLVSKHRFPPLPQNMIKYQISGIKSAKIQNHQQFYNPTYFCSCMWSQI